MPENKYAFRNLPLESLHPNAFKAAEAAQCAGEQGKFWEMHDRLFASQQALGTANLAAHAKALNVNPSKYESCLSEGWAAMAIRRDLGR